MRSKNEHATHHGRLDAGDDHDNEMATGDSMTAGGSGRTMGCRRANKR